MKAGEPDREPAPPAPSLAARLMAARLPSGDPWLAVTVALLIAAGPILTIIGAKLAAANARAEAAQLSEQLAPRIAAARAAETARTELRAAIARPALGATLEALARVLPDEATLLRAERTRGAGLELEIATNDPDRLRTAIHRASQFAALRDANQRQGEGTMIVTLREAGQ